MINSFIKKNLKLILIVVVTAVMCISGVAFATGYFARDVNYEKKDGTKISVEEALNELYNRNYNYSEYKTGNNAGTLITNRKTNIDVEKGKYIMAITEYNAGMTTTGLKTSINLQTNNNMTFTKISNTVSGFNTDHSASSLLEVYFISAEENGIINVASSDAGTASTAAGGLNYILIEINKE